jgi:hypothetical protein
MNYKSRVLGARHRDYCVNMDIVTCDAGGGLAASGPLSTLFLYQMCRCVLPILTLGTNSANFTVSYCQSDARWGYNYDFPLPYHHHHSCHYYCCYYCYYVYYYYCYYWIYLMALSEIWAMKYLKNRNDNIAMLQPWMCSTFDRLLQ